MKTCSVADYALEYLRAGLSVIPIRTDGTKAPTVSWRGYEKERMAADQATQLFSEHVGIAVVGGAISGGLEIVDHEEESIFSEWAELVEAQLPGLLERLPQHRTPANGRHVFLRSEAPQGNQKLARSLDTSRGKDGLLIESKGEGGYVLVPGSPGECHETGRCYEHVAGPPITETPVLTKEERDTLFAFATVLNEVPEDPEAHNTTRTGEGRAGDDFNARAAWPEILEPHGWRRHHERDGRAFWTRPGKDGSWSATTGYCKGQDGRDLFYVFSSNANPFKLQKAYSRFSAYTLLNHKGDYSTAAKDLRAKGYGAKQQEKAKVSGPFGLDAEIIEARRTTTRVIARINVKLGKDSLPFWVSSSESSLDRIARELVALVPDARDDAKARLQVKSWLRTLLSTVEKQTASETSGKKLMIEIVTEEAGRLKLSFITEDSRVWSEATGRKLYQKQFCETLVSCSLVTRLREARDVPEDASDVTLTGAAKRLSEAVWGELIKKLPTQAEANGGPDSRSAQDFKKNLAAMFTAPKLKVKDENTNIIRSSSLLEIITQKLERVREQHVQDGKAPRSVWRHVHKPFAVFWRPVCQEGDVIEVDLAIRWTLLDQFEKQWFHGVHNQTTLARILEQYGLLGGRAIGGEKREALTLLEERFVESLLSEFRAPEADEA